MELGKKIVVLYIFLLLTLAGWTQVPSNKPDAHLQPDPANSQNLHNGAGYQGAIKVNYVRVKDGLAPITDPNTFNSSGYVDVKESTQYFDGLGRPLQTVNRQSTAG